MKVEQYIDGLFSNSAAILAKSLHSWRAGIDYEIGFWTRWFETRGLEWPEDYAERTTPKPLVPWLVALLPPAQDDPIRILDVGAGPITKSGHYVDGRQIVFSAVDPLAHRYNEIIDRFGVSPPIRTQFSFAEDLSARFDAGWFHVISCSNALDHAIEPVWGIIEMLQVATVNGNIFLGHRRNEAEFESYSGFHQWNFDAEASRFIVWNRGRRIDVTELLNDFAAVRCETNNDYLSVTIRKQRELPLDPLQYNRRLRAGVLEAVLALA